jgi:catechol 2,3-dioxygenase-like lactoylglutathione lyase family enzyme
MKIATVTLVVPSYQAGLDFFVGVLGFDVIENSPRGPNKRWVVVRPQGGGVDLLLAQAVGPAQQAAIGNQTGGRVGFFLETDDFARDHARLVAAGVDFREPPRREVYGVVAVFADPFGNLWDLIAPAAAVT